MALPKPLREGAVPLEDGRKLAYAEYGDPTGTPALFFHGWPGTRLQGALFHEAALRHSVRIIAVDRPGSGRSTFKRGRKLLDWPRDIEQLARVLGLEQFAVIGLSGGGPFALTCAYRLPERLRATIILSGAAPYVTEKTSLPRRLIAGLFRRSSWLVRINLESVRFWMRVAPAVVLFFYRNAWLLSKRDKQLYRQWSLDDYIPDAINEAFRNGTRGPVQDWEIYSSDWGFHAADVRAHIDLWHGDADRIVRVGPVRELIEMLPDCHPRIYGGEGHLMLLDHLDEILETVVRARSVQPARA